MDNSARTNRTTYLLITLLCLELLLLAMSIPGHPMHIDEAWIGEQTYFLARDGHVHSNLFEGLARHDKLGIVYHRLFVLAGSEMVTLFGWSLATLRIVPVAATLLLLAMMGIYTLRRSGNNATEAIIALLLMLFVPIIFYHAKIYRPEMMMTLFGFASYMMLERYGADRRLFNCAASGFLAGGAAMMHLYGLIFVIAGLYLLARDRRWGGAAIFAVAAIIPLFPFLYDAATHYEIFREQITNPIAAKKTSFTIATPFLNLLEEHKRLFRKPEIILVVLLFIGALVASWRTSDRRRRLFLEYTLALVVLLGMVAGDKVVTRYAIPLFPFFAIAIARAITTRPGMLASSRVYRWGFAATLALFAGYGIFFQYNDTFGARQDPAASNARIGALIPQGARVLAPMNLIFNQIERLHINALYLAAKEQGGALTLDSAIAFADAHRDDYIVTNGMMTDEEEIKGLDSAVAGGGKEFIVMRRTAEFTILQRTP